VGTTKCSIISAKFSSPYNSFMVPPTGQAADELSVSDPLMAELVAQYPGVSLVSRGDPSARWPIHRRAADIGQGSRLCGPVLSAQVGEVDAGPRGRTGEAGLEGCGLSKRKIEYLAIWPGIFSADNWLQPAGRLLTTRRSSPNWSRCAVSADGRRKCS
jgi:hypothetical protein